ncbi:hypothetical protein [Ruficoccus sp. ZRK36]|uniref:ribbon-helix-helix domain-containing protein n=1 Tax=Ruficoccus sp. ZRK36 TaxID=2866311 RepID=UPI001C73E060|nr:hypothetical protein [Ruficoccus sp. ZRK36]QYY35164.1 hypothetical protein K0V07_12765 [Ruficoccus sp. ZRK36]
MGKDSAKIQVVVDKKFKKRIEEAARRDGRSASNWMRFLAERALESMAPKS